MKIKNNELDKLKAATSVVKNSILHGDRCKCLDPFLICPPTGYCYKCDRLRSIETRQAIYILDSFNHQDIERELIIKYMTLYPASTRKEASEKLGWTERTLIRKLKKYGLLIYRKRGKSQKKLYNPFSYSPEPEIC